MVDNSRTSKLTSLCNSIAQQSFKKASSTAEPKSRASCRALGREEPLGTTIRSEDPHILKHDISARLYATGNRLAAVANSEAKEADEMNHFEQTVAVAKMNKVPNLKHDIEHRFDAIKRLLTILIDSDTRKAVKLKSLLANRYHRSLRTHALGPRKWSYKGGA